MDLDNLQLIKDIDKGGMLRHLQTLPAQVTSAWELGLSLPLPSFKEIRNVLVAGMGGSAIGGDMLAAYIRPTCPVPLLVHRDYGLPAWASDPHTLVIASSHSGDTEETVSAFEVARKRGCSILTISRGGKLGELAAMSGTPFWKFEHDGQPRSAVGFTFGLPMAVFYRLGFLQDPSTDLAGAVKFMEAQARSLEPEVPAAKNPAKRMAGQFLNRWAMMIGSGVLEPIARRWKGQIAELSKAWAQFEALPEADHNTLAGLENPSDLVQKIMVLFLRAPSDLPRNRQREDLTRQTFMVEGLNTDFYDAQGDTALAHLWTTLQFGDYLAYYLAMAYQVDPTPIPLIQGFKVQLG